MESVFPSGLWNISRLTRDSGVCMPAFDRGVMMHRRNRPEEKYTDTLRHPSSSNQTRWQEQTDGFIWCLTTRLCLNIRKIHINKNHITHRNKLSRLCCFLSVIFELGFIKAWVIGGGYERDLVPESEWTFRKKQNSAPQPPTSAPWPQAFQQKLLWRPQSLVLEREI